MERWESIKDYEGFYEISDYGRIRSLDRVVMRNDVEVHREGKIIKQSYANYYPVVALRRDGRRKVFKVHRIVAEHFLKRPEYATEVNHIDGITNNNYFKNLEWVTHSENMKHAYKNDLNHKGEDHHNAKLSRINIPIIRSMIEDGESLESIGKRFGVCHQAIREIKSGKTWAHI